MPTSYTATLTVLAATSLFSLHIYLTIKRRQYPPGPVGDPIIGNVRHMPYDFPWLYYTDLKKKYGDLVFIQVMFQQILLIGSYDAANALLSKRGIHYSDRPKFPLSSETLGFHPPLSPYGQKWKEERRMYHAHMGKDTVRDLYRHDVEVQAQEYVLASLNAKKNISHEYFLALLRTFLHTIYGIRVRSNDEEILQVAVKGTEIGSSTIIPGKFWVNLIPGLAKLPEWFPGADWKRVGKYWQSLMGRMIVEPFMIAKQQDKEGKGKQTFVTSMLHDDSTTLTEEQIMFTAGSSFVAGSDTTGGVVQHFIHAMLLRPDAMKRAQKEIDSVVGKDRLPTIDDVANLPFVDAIYKEVLRWRPVAPFSVPHSVMKDDVYNGYLIPKDTVIVQNVWAMAMDESQYSSPENFMPERFMTQNPPMDPRYYVFGVGRRICPGMHFGESVVLAAMLTMLATTDITYALDANGQQIPVSPATTGKLIDTPLPFEFRFKARSDGALALLQAAVTASA
ncbi:cytochrome P450 [Clavulina sp. PMI_390]|nr:cytochrome P450 [Clavulina sp. PMI_390]